MLLSKDCLFSLLLLFHLSLVFILLPGSRHVVLSLRKQVPASAGFLTGLAQVETHAIAVLAQVREVTATNCVKQRDIGRLQQLTPGRARVAPPRRGPCAGRSSHPAELMWPAAAARSMCCTAPRCRGAPRGGPAIIT